MDNARRLLPGKNWEAPVSEVTTLPRILASSSLELLAHTKSVGEIVRSMGDILGSAQHFGESPPCPLTRGAKGLCSPPRTTASPKTSGTSRWSTCWTCPLSWLGLFLLPPRCLLATTGVSSVRGGYDCQCRCFPCSSWMFATRVPACGCCLLN